MVIICRYGEIFLKGLNKRTFENALVQSINRRLSKHNLTSTIKILRNRILVENDAAYPYLQPTFGLTSISKAEPVEFDLPIIIETAIRMLSETKLTTFKVHTQRITKTSPWDSVTLSGTVGAAIQEHYNSTVKLDNPNTTLGIEIINDTAYIYAERTSCPGGLPENVSGSVIVNSSDKYAECAALLMLKRGCFVTFTESKSFPLFAQFATASSKAPHLATVRGTLDIEQPINSLPELYPLIGMTEDDVKEKMRKFQSFVNVGNKIE